ncbi:trypsin-like serine peptidase [Pilimelia terevasa]|nr:serine protease [Pilimelia terevasa]
MRTPMRATTRIAVLAAALSVPLVTATAFADTADAPAAAVDFGTPTVAEGVSGDLGGAEVVGTTRVRYAAPQETISHPGSSYVKVHINSLRLAPGDYLTVADRTGREVHTYHGDPTARGQAAAGDASHTVHRTRGFAAMSVEGDTAVVTVHRAGSARQSAAALDRAGYGVVIDRVWRGFSAAEFAAQQQKTRKVCGKDARRDMVCYKDKFPTEYGKSRAVARAVLNGKGYCTAWRVGNSNRMLTNNHCIADNAAAKSSEMQFSYDCATCGGNDPGVPTKVGGTELFKTNKALDYALVSVDKFDSISSFGTLFLETNPAKAGDKIYIPGHGDAKPKKIAIFDEVDGGAPCTVYSLSGTRVVYNCDTSGGNSGSPVFSATSHKVIALHNLGSCPNNNSGNMTTRIMAEIGSMIDNNG